MILKASVGHDTLFILSKYVLNKLMKFLFYKYEQKLPKLAVSYNSL